MEERDGGAVDTARVSSDQVADGDDIQVVPGRTGGPGSAGGGQRRRILLGAGVAGVMILIIVVALVVQHSRAPHRTVVTFSPITITKLPPGSIIKAKTTVPPKNKKSPTTAVAVATLPATTPQTAVSVPPASGAQPTSPPPTAPPTTTVAPPKQYGASVLTWTAPHSLTIAAGKRASLSVTAYNPTDGIVTLPHPLACTPRIDHGEMCTEMAQIIGSHQSAGAQYTIDATGIAPGHYTLVIEGVLTVPVTVS